MQIFTNTHLHSNHDEFLRLFLHRGALSFARVLYDVHIIYMYSSWCNVFFNDSSGNAHSHLSTETCIYWRKIFPRIYWSLKSEAGNVCADGLNEQNILCYDQLFMFSVVLFSKDFATCWTLVFSKQLKTMSVRIDNKTLLERWFGIASWNSYIDHNHDNYYLNITTQKVK